jgi:hypothetical protein
MHWQAFDPKNTCFKRAPYAKNGSNRDTLTPATTFIHGARKNNALKNSVLTNGGLQIGMLQVGALQMALFGQRTFLTWVIV